MLYKALLSFLRAPSSSLLRPHAATQNCLVSTTDHHGLRILRICLDPCSICLCVRLLFRPIFDCVCVFVYEYVIMLPYPHHHHHLLSLLYIKWCVYGLCRQSCDGWMYIFILWYLNSLLFAEVGLHVVW